MVRRKIISATIGAAIALGLALLAFLGLPAPGRYASAGDKLLWIGMIVSFVVLAAFIWTSLRHR